MAMNLFTRLTMWLSKRQVNLGSSSAPIEPSSPARPEQLPVGSLVIACPNEWQPMVIGTITGYDGRFGNIPFIADWVSSEEHICFSPLVLFSEETFSMLVLLNPYARFNMLSKHAQVDMDKPKRGVDLLVTDYVARIGVRLAAHKDYLVGEPVL